MMERDARSYCYKNSDTYRMFTSAMKEIQRDFINEIHEQKKVLGNEER